MNHDPLCSYYKPGVFWESHVCVTCDLISEVRRDMLSKCIAVAQQAYKHAPEGYSDNEAFEVAIAALRALQEKP
jgi:hypothetical protein